MTTLHGREARERVWSLIKDMKVAMLTTHTAAGTLHARPMMQQKVERDDQFDGVLWFFTDANTGKVSELEADPTALLAYADPKDNSYVSLTGTVTVTRDRVKIDQLWSEADKAWFPNGKDDPNLVLLRFEASDAEFWDSPGLISGGIAYLQAMVTGERADPGDHGHADLDIPDLGQTFPDERSDNRDHSTAYGHERDRDYKREPETVLVSTGPRDPMG